MSEAYRYSSQDFLTYFSREINGLKDSRAETRRNSLKTLHSELTKEPSLKPYILQEILEDLTKVLLKLFSDDKEQCREMSIKTMIYLVSNSSDIAAILSYLFPVLVERLGAYDLEGIQGVPEQLLPMASQKPQVVINPPEKSEEIRLQIGQCVLAVFERLSPHILFSYLDEATSISKALVMDPSSGEVIQVGCQAMATLCKKATEKLLHYTEQLGRSLFTSLVHKHWKVRKAGLLAIKEVFYCGVYKYNALIVEGLIGFRDPNVVPIKDFYEPSTRLNYLAMLVNDKSAHVRSTFFEVVANWLTRLPDKYDHESRLIPYILTGLFDPITDIKEDCFRYIEEIGQVYEEEKEKEIREMRQLGYQDPWTFDGLMSDLPLPYPFVKRPRLGSRLFFRQYIRRYLNAIFHEVGDWISTSRLFSSNLLLSLIIFTEDSITQSLDKFLTCMCKALMINNSQEILKNLELSTRLVGRYVDTNSYMPQVLSAIRPSKNSYICLMAVFNCFKGELQEDQDQAYEGALKVLKHLLLGVTEALPPGLGISRLSKDISPLIRSLQKVIHSLGPSQCFYIIEILEFVVQLNLRREELEDLGEIARFDVDLVRLVVQAEAFGAGEAQEKGNMVCRAVFDIGKRDEAIFKELLEEIAGDYVEKWHAYDENWKTFFTLVKKAFSLGIENEDLLDEVLDVIRRVITAKECESVHLPLVSLASYAFPTRKLMDSLLIPGLIHSFISTKVKSELFKVISTLKITSLLLLPGLCLTFMHSDPSLTEKSLEEINTQLEFSSITEDLLRTFQYKDETHCTLLTAKCLELLDSPKEDIRLLSLRVITNLLENLPKDNFNTVSAYELRAPKPVLNKYVAEEFEIMLIGDIRVVLKKLVAVVLAESEGSLKEEVHLCLVKLKEKRPLVIGHECVEAKRGGYLKRWEYLDTLLFMPNN